MTALLLLLATAISSEGSSAGGELPTGPSIVSDKLLADEPAAEEIGYSLQPTPCPPPTPPAIPPITLLKPTSRLKVFGAVDALMVVSTSRPFPSGTPLFLLPDSPFGLDTNTFDLHARQSMLGAVFTGPEVGAFQSGGQILTFLQNDNLSADEYGLLVYYAYGELKNEDWRFAAGLQQDVFNPVSPTIVYLTKMYASGNTGSYRGQLRAERFLQQQRDFGITLQGALSEPISTLVTGNAGRIEEDNGWPNVESRVEFGFGELSDFRGAKGRPIELGFSSVVGEIRTTRTLLGNPNNLPPRATITTWGLGSDVEWRPLTWYGARGEFFVGEGLGEYNGGVLQSYNSSTFADVRTAGGFGEVFAYFTEKFHVHSGYGIDNPLDRDLAVTQINRNETYFVNFVYDFSPTVQLGLEVDYRRTDYTQFQQDALLDSDALIVASRFLWSF